MKIVSIFSGHDASATVIEDGKIEKYIKEERFSKIKKDTNIENIYKLSLEKFVPSSDFCFLGTSYSDEVQDKKYKEILDVNKNIKIISNNKTEHHFYHASIAFYNSGFDKALIIVIDSSGNIINGDVYECESIYVAEYPDIINPIYKNYFTDNIKKQNIYKNINDCEYICKAKFGIGGLYDSTALLMGESVDNCGKSMGLSSYGNKINDFPNCFSHKDSDLLIPPSLIDNELSNYYNLLSKTERGSIKITEENYKFYADYCHEIQLQTQEALVRLIQKGIEKTGIKKVCISGGYGMNIIANHYALQKFPEVEFYFEPLCDDGGISVGAAMYFYRKLTKDVNVYPIQNTFYHGFNYDITSYMGEFVDIIDIAKLLYANKSVAIYNGYAESGQRALGNRSILFNALCPDAKRIVNSIKNREWYRPFAAIVLEEDAHLYFDMGRVKSNEYMTVCFPVKTDLISGVTHVDNTCRVQTVSSGHLYDVLIEFKKLSGHGILLNTSFNLAGEPLVETPEDAFKTLSNSSLDYLWFLETKQLFN